jgi:hypothetical protein
VTPRSKASAALTAIKLLHTAIGAFFAGCTIAIPIVGALSEFRWVAIRTGLMLAECAVLAANKGALPD